MILGLTALVWLGVAMSESQEYTIPVKVEMQGFDTKRFAVVRADSVLSLQVRSTGFNAMILSLRTETLTVALDMNNEFVHRYSQQRGAETDYYRVVAVGDLSSQLNNQLSSMGVHMVGSPKDSLLLILNERYSRTFVPDINNLRINFSDGYGLYGEPTMTPKEVTLYGSREVLSSIDHIGVKSTVLNDVRASGTYTLALDDSWRSQGDVYASAEQLTVEIPVKRFIERRFSIPVTIPDADSTHSLRLYPDRAELHVWVAQDDLATVSSDRFEVTASYDDIRSGAQRLKLSVSRFPRNVRIRNLNPAEIEYVIIK